MAPLLDKESYGDFVELVDIVQELGSDCCGFWDSTDIRDLWIMIKSDRLKDYVIHRFSSFDKIPMLEINEDSQDVLDRINRMLPEDNVFRNNIFRG
jgi:hypothetical protein